MYTEAMAKKLASKDRDWEARRIRGRWVVWSISSDHAVEFADNMLRAAALSFGDCYQPPCVGDTGGDW